MAKKQITIDIEGMECPNCVMILERIEDKLEGVTFAEASYRTGKMRVDYDDSRVNEAQITAEIQRLGYQVLEIK
jgi:copper chaperone CopZ